MKGGGVRAEGGKREREEWERTRAARDGAGDGVESLNEIYDGMLRSLARRAVELMS